MSSSVPQVLIAVAPWDGNHVACFIHITSMLWCKYVCVCGGGPLYLPKSSGTALIMV